MEPEAELELFSFSNFSTDLLVECFLHQLESPLPSRHYNGPSGYGEYVKRWIKFTETLISCLKGDLRISKIISDRNAGNFKSGPPHNNLSGDSQQVLFKPRELYRDIICKWYPDLLALHDMYSDKLIHEIMDERILKETDLLHNYVNSLLSIGKHIFSRRIVIKDTIEDDSNKSELVYIFDDHISK